MRLLICGSYHLLPSPALSPPSLIAAHPSFVLSRSSLRATAHRPGSASLASCACSPQSASSCAASACKSPFATHTTCATTPPKGCTSAVRKRAGLRGEQRGRPAVKSPAAMPPMRDIVFSIVAYEMKLYPHTSGSLMCSSLLGTMIEERSSRRRGGAHTCSQARPRAECAPSYYATKERRRAGLWVAVADEASNEQPIPVPLGEIVEKVGPTLDADGPGGDKVRVVGASQVERLVRLLGVEDRLGADALLLEPTAVKRRRQQPSPHDSLRHGAVPRRCCTSPRPAGCAGSGRRAPRPSRSPRACTTRPSVIHGPWRRAQSRARPSTSCAPTAEAEQSGPADDGPGRTVHAWRTMRPPLLPHSSV